MKSLANPSPARSWHLWMGALLSGSQSLTFGATDDSATLMSEQDYLREIPQVLAASRLPQHPQDSSGANTVIEREEIRVSGARNLPELLMTLPGFQVGINAGGRPVVAYHGFSGEVSQRMQVLVDGRSLYAPYMFGGVDWSTVTVPIDEIERIEIHRGSNSAAYGANAFLGVIQIYTRVPVQASGMSVQINQGNNGISDQSLRWGKSGDDIQWRVVANKKGDEGLTGRSDTYSADSVDFRVDYQKSTIESLTLLLGANAGRFGVGKKDSTAEPARNEHKKAAFAYLKYRKIVDDGQEWSLSTSWTQDSGRDAYQIPLLSGNSLDMLNVREANRYALEYQHYKNMAYGLRASWGVEYRRDQVQAEQLFSTDASQKNASWRIYYNQEWKPLDGWTINAGGLLEQDQLVPRQFAPRISLNWKPAAEHVFKLGYSSAFRTPSLFEQKSDWRVRDENQQTLYIKYLSRGGLIPEGVKATDFVYQGRTRGDILGIDVRLFREELTRLITGELYILPTTSGSMVNSVAYDLRNNADATQQGAEFQINWRPTAGTKLSLNDYRANTISNKSALSVSAPARSSSLILMHVNHSGLSAYAAYTKLRPMTWLGEATASGDQKILAMSLQQTVKLSQASLRYSLTWRRPIGEFVEYREMQSQAKTLWLSLSVER